MTAPSFLAICETRGHRPRLQSKESDLFGNLFFCSGLCLDEFLELFHARQFGEILQPEVDEKLFCSFVENRPAEDFLSAGRRDEFLIEKCLDDAAGVYAANLLDLGHCDRLLVSDD